MSMILETSPREAFDVVTVADGMWPITKLGYLTFQLSWYVPGAISYVEGFQSRARRIWRRR